MDKKVLLILALAGVITPVSASNFSYTTLNVALGKTTPDDSLIFLGEEYKDFAFFQLGGSYQVADSIALGLSASGIANEGRDTELSSTTVAFTAAFPIPVQEQLDIVPYVGHVSVEAEACLNNLCSKEDDSGMGYGIGIRAWAIPDTVEIHASYNDTTIEDWESTVTIGGAFWLNENNSLGLSYTDESGASTVAIGYRYSW